MSEDSRYFGEIIKKLCEDNYDLSMRLIKCETKEVLNER